MPSYISHAIHGEKLFEKLNDEKILKEDVELSKLKSYTIAYDYAYLVKGLDNHNYSAKDYLLFIIRYIKKNHLQGNVSILAYLYGHVAHFYLDAYTHPLIYYIERGCIPTSFLPSHFMVEGYLNTYLSERVLKKDILDVHADYFNKADLNNKEIQELIKTSYMMIYGKNDVIKSFKLVRKFFTGIEVLYKDIFRSKKMVSDITNFKLFLTKNRITLPEIANENHGLWFNPVTGKMHTDSFLDLFYKSIDKSLDTINDINKYFYNNESYDRLERIIPDISLDTGVSRKRGLLMKYKRKI
ncbi:MAG: zinc dependent phospholipase C family protein [Bacilli bacterium]|nr:zinc dependent phospholipase C family protein [Bacilli bacterium]